MFVSFGMHASSFPFPFPCIHTALPALLYLLMVSLVTNVRYVYLSRMLTHYIENVKLIYIYIYFVTH